jgi:hypothetical protein
MRRTITKQENYSIRVALANLKIARNELKAAGCHDAYAKVLSAIKSAEGAFRRAENRYLRKYGKAYPR